MINQYHSNRKVKNTNPEGLFSPVVPIPLISNTGEPTLLDQIRSALIAIRNPLERLKQTSFEIPVTQTKVFGETITMISDPEWIKHAFVDNHANYRMHSLRQAIFKPILREGLFTAEGEHWRHSRKMLSPLFTPRSIVKFAEGMHQTAERELPRVFDVDNITPRLVILGDAMTSLTYFILSDALFSGDISEDSDDILQLVASVLSNLGRLSILDLLGAPAFIPRLGKIRGKHAVKRLRKLITQASQGRRITSKDDPLESGDFLARMLDSKDKDGGPLSPDDIEDQLITFIGAGHETTAQAMTWLCYLLSQDESARERAEVEVDELDIENIPAAEWANHIPWTMACFEETLRLFPPATVLYRAAKSDDEFKGICVPAKSGLLAHLWVLHRHEKLWENPNAFDPRRFYGAERDKINRFQYLPFGVGHRVCIGARFAMTEAAILIVCLMRQYRFEYAGEKPPWPTVKLSLQPANRMPMTVARRNACSR